ncbi:pectate lyase family protein [Uliginosibacterium sp. H1]|uniref:pectate lyase family protein n=1 Tax=Uliginosibacterium sp. H1 TaxID=3114757 RepID=UPI002E180B39|nr:PbsX family transcriptional regulator [Uliginosibacterium sp. H1]
MHKKVQRFMLAPMVAAMALAATSAFAAKTPDSLGAYGWAATNGGTTGGHGAAAAQTYTVTTRAQLIKALMPDAVIAANGTFTSAAGPDATKKIIYVKGKINLSHDGSGRELKYEHFKDPGYDFDAYVAAYKPSVWTANPANWNATTNRPLLPSGPIEDARKRSSANQAAVIVIPVGSNTSIIGVGSDARIINGTLRVDGKTNVVIRNITFEDAFDHFPEWDPTDSFSLTTPASPGCQATYVDASTGPQKCPGGRWNTEFDMVAIHNSKNVWVDHCTFDDGGRDDWKYPSVFEAPHRGVDYLVVRHDGAVDVTGTSDFVTISSNVFENHDKTNLLGSSNTATAANGWGALSITVANNWYENAGQRLPRVRFGKVHVYNNFFFGTAGYLGQYAPMSDQPMPKNRFLYGIGIGNFAKIYAENNVYEIKGGAGVTVDDSVMFFNWYGANAAVGGVTQYTYFYDSGTILNGQPRSITAAAQATAVTQGKPALVDTNTIWVPSQTYNYTLLPSNQVKATAKAKAGAGRL